MRRTIGLWSPIVLNRLATQEQKICSDLTLHSPFNAALTSTHERGWVQGKRRWVRGESKVLPRNLPAPH